MQDAGTSLVITALANLGQWGIIVGLLTAIFGGITGLIRVTFKAAKVWDGHRQAVETNTEAVKFLSGELWDLREPVKEIPEIIKRLDRLEHHS